MAKLRKRRRKKKKKVIVLTPEEKFQKLLNLEKATRCIQDVNEEYKIWVRLAKEFHEFGLSEEAAEVEGAEECEDLSLECQERARALEPSLSEDAGKDTRTVTTTMKKKEAEELLNKGRKKSKGRIVTFIVLGLIAAFIVCYEVTPTRYWITRFEQLAGMDQMAMEGYNKLGDYKDSEERMQEARYDYASSLASKGQHKQARKQFAHLAAAGYKDSEEREAWEEKTILKDSKPGAVVHYGTCRWLVLENDSQKEQVLLIKYIGIHGQPYHEREEAVTWEQCGLRVFLNGEFLDSHFTNTEKQNIQLLSVPMENNASYGTDGGQTTTDRLFIPNSAEVEKYKEVLKSGRNNMRLRTPGKSRKTTTFISYRGQVIDYGFPVEQKGAMVRPMMWVSTVNK